MEGVGFRAELDGGRDIGGEEGDVLLFVDEAALGGG